MIPYYLLIVFPGVILISFNNKVVKVGKTIRIRKESIAIVAFFTVLICMVALRADTIGIDTKNYISFFNTFSHLSIRDIFYIEKEPAFALLNKLISIITNNTTVYFTIVAFIYILPIAKLYYDNDEMPMLTIALFLTMSNFIMLFSGIRQSIAIALGICSYYLVRKKKFVKFIIVVILAMLFHRSAFMIVFMYPLYYLKITKKWLLFVVPAMVAVFIFNEPIFSFLVVFISNSYEATIKSTGAYTMLIIFVLLSAFSYIVADEEKIDSKTRGLRNFLLLTTIIQMFAPLNSLAMRMNYYYIIFIPVLIPMIIKASSERWRKVAILAGWLMTVFFILYFFITAPAVNALSTFPYKFFWEV